MFFRFLETSGILLVARAHFLLLLPDQHKDENYLDHFNNDGRQKQHLPLF